MIIPQFIWHIYQYSLKPRRLFAGAKGKASWNWIWIFVDLMWAVTRTKWMATRAQMILSHHSSISHNQNDRNIASALKPTLASDDDKFAHKGNPWNNKFCDTHVRRILKPFEYIQMIMEHSPVLNLTVKRYPRREMMHQRLSRRSSDGSTFTNTVGLFTWFSSITTRS